VRGSPKAADDGGTLGSSECGGAGVLRRSGMAAAGTRRRGMRSWREGKAKTDQLTDDLVRRRKQSSRELGVGRKNGGGGAGFYRCRGGRALGVGVATGTSGAALCGRGRQRRCLAWQRDMLMASIGEQGG
jgi:hypothetical protein